MEWFEENVKSLQYGLVAAEKEIGRRWGAAMTRGADLFEGNHWNADVKAAIQKQVGPELEELPIRNTYRQKVRNEAAMMSPGAPVLQYHIPLPPSEQGQDAELISELQYALEQDILEIFERSEWCLEAQRAIVDFENKHLAWFVEIPIFKDDNIEIMHIPTERVLFDPGVSRLRHIQWIAWVDGISKEQAISLYGEDEVLKTNFLAEGFSSLDEVNRKRYHDDRLYTVTHLYALKGSSIMTCNPGNGNKVDYKTFDKPTHLIMLEDRIVHQDNKLPQDRNGKAIIPATHVLLEADPDDILGKGLSETAYEPQKQINNAALAIALAYAESWNKRDIVVGANAREIDDLSDGTLKHVQVSRHVEIHPFGGGIITQDLLAAMGDAERSFEEQTGSYASIEGKNVSGVDTAAGLMHLTQMARTPILSRTRMFGIAVKRLGEIHIGWKRANKEGLLMGQDGKPVKDDAGKTIDILKMVSVKVELDSLLEMSKEETFNRLAGMVEMGLPVQELLVKYAPVSGPVKEEVTQLVRAQQKANEQMMQQAQQAQMEQGGMMPPGMSPEQGMPEGVSVG